MQRYKLAVIKMRVASASEARALNVERLRLIDSMTFSEYDEAHRWLAQRSGQYIGNTKTMYKNKPRVL